MRVKLGASGAVVLAPRSAVRDYLRQHPEAAHLSSGRRTIA